MHITHLNKSHAADIEKLFTSTFTASEGEEEGRLIGHLSAELAQDIHNDDVICFGVYIEKDLVGAAFFTRLYFDTNINVYMLAPVAVSPPHQRKGIGSSLIVFGIDTLKSRGVDVVVTYGDPSFYSHVGFQPITEDIIQPPRNLSMPQGWLGQSLRGTSIPVIKDRPSCVKAFDNQAYW